MKKLLLATALLVASTAANAGLVSGAGGVDWNTADVNSTANGGNFFTPLSFRQWYVDANGDAQSLFDAGAVNTEITELRGIGEVTTGNNMGQPLPGGYELTFEFGGITVDTTTGLLDPTSGGFLNIYLDKDFSDNAGGYDNTAAVVGDVLNADQLADATDGELWLGLNFASGDYTPTGDLSGFGPAFDNFGIWGNNSFLGLIGGDANFGFQINDSAPGLAQSNFESDWATYIGAVVDAIGFGLTSQFSVTYEENVSGDYTGISAIDTYSASSAGTVEAFTVTEPTSVAIFGLGLLGFAAASRRKKS